MATVVQHLQFARGLLGELRKAVAAKDEKRVYAIVAMVDAMLGDLEKQVEETAGSIAMSGAKFLLNKIAGKFTGDK